MSQHPEWSRTNSLTSPADRGDGKYKSNVGAPPLTEEQVDDAMAALNETSLVDKFPRVERQFADPPIPLQTYGLVSFVPSKGATPDKDGIYGFMKIRGNYATPQEANERAEFLLRNVDSYHQIFHAFVGRPFPITLDQKYCAKTEEINIRQKATEMISEDVKTKRDKEKEDIAAIKQREQALLDQNKDSYKVDPYEEYTVLRVKKAQLVWTYEKTRKQIDELKKNIVLTREKIKEYEDGNASFAQDYFERYMKARRDAGIPDDQNTEENFVKYMVEDVELDF